MPETRFPITYAALSPRTRKQFFRAVVELEAGLTTGEIANARLTVKDALSLVLDYAWGEVAQNVVSWSREYITAASDEERYALRDFSDSAQTNTIARMIRQGDALDETPAGKAVRAVLAEACEMLGQVKADKETAVKKRAAPNVEAATERYSARRAFGTATATVMRELVEITEEARDGITASQRAHHEDFLTRFLNAQEENDAAGPESRCFSSRNHFRKICHGHIENDLLDKLTGVTKVWCENGREVYTRKPGATALIAAQAARQAEVICAGFAEKILNPRQAGSDCRGQGQISRHGRHWPHHTTGHRGGRLQISLEDGVRFEASSHDVLSLFRYGTPIMRYPLTFQAVIMVDGTLMEHPSERKMNEVFVQDDSLPEP